MFYLIMSPLNAPEIMTEYCFYDIERIVCIALGVVEMMRFCVIIFKFFSKLLISVYVFRISCPKSAFCNLTKRVCSDGSINR